MNTIHHALCCGACKQEFADPAELIEHISICPAAKLTCRILTFVLGKNSYDPGHSVAHFLLRIQDPKTQVAIRMYIYSVIDQRFSMMERAQRHERLCTLLDIRHHYFKPFEETEEDLRGLHRYSVAERILFTALHVHLDRLVEDTKRKFK